MSDTSPVPPKVRGRPFPKGQSPNPGGRAKEMPWLREEARKHARAAILRLVKVLNTSPNDSAVVAAARELIDRGFGKSTQIIAGDVDADPVNFALTVRFVRPEPSVASD